MSKKNENKRGYFESPLPQSGTRKRLTRLNWGGLNMRYAMDTGELSYEKNVSTAEYPCLTPSPVWEQMTFGALSGLSAPEFINSDAIFGFDNELIAYEKMRVSGSSAVKYCLNFYQANKNGLTLKYSADITSKIPNRLYYEHTLIKSVSLNVGTDNFLDSGAENYYLFPEAVGINVSRGNGNTITAHNAWGVGSPNFETATAHLGRLFGTYKSNVYASKFNNFTNWSFDTAEETNPANAWASTTQANPAAGTNFTGIVSYQNHVVCFKEDFMHEIYNTQNPFRIVDVYAEGTMNGRSIQEVGGMLAFASKTGVKAYTGSKPKELGYKLGIKEISNAVSGTDGRSYYLYCTIPTAETDETTGQIITENRLFVYDSLVGEWSEEHFGGGEIISFAKAKNGLYALTSDGNVYRRANENYLHEWAFETDFITSDTIDVKHIKKIQLRADIPTGSYLKIYLLKDGETFDSEKSHMVYNSTGRNGECAIRVLVRGTASSGFKLHFEGYGYVKIYEMEIDISQGGELYV